MFIGNCEMSWTQTGWEEQRNEKYNKDDHTNTVLKNYHITNKVTN